MGETRVIVAYPQTWKSVQLLFCLQGLIYHPCPQKTRSGKNIPYDWPTRAVVLIFDE